MTDYGNLLIIAYVLPVIAFMLGRLWEHAGHEIEKEREAK